MKRIMKIIGTILVLIILMIVAGFIYLFMRPSVPNSYEKTVKTGGNLENRYLSHGAYDVSYKEVKVDEDWKKYEIYYPRELTTTDKKYPVIVVANGTGIKASKYKSLFKHYASWGFVVIGNEDENSWNGISSEKSLDYLIMENDNPDSVFYQKLDLDNVGITGHSQGGVAVFNAITNHENSSFYKTAVALSPTNEELAEALSWPYNVTKVDIPILIMAGTDGDFETETVIPLVKMIEIYEKINSSKAMARKVGIEHGGMLYSADGYVTAWFMWQLNDDDEAAKVFIGDTPEIRSNELYTDQMINIID